MGELFERIRGLLKNYYILLSALFILGAPNILYLGYVHSFQAVSLKIFDGYFYANFQAGLIGAILIIYIISRFLVLFISMQRISGVQERSSSFLLQAIEISILTSVKQPALLAVFFSVMVFPIHFLESSVSGFAISAGWVVSVCAVLRLSTWKHDLVSDGDDQMLSKFLVSLIFFLITVSAFFLGFEKARLTAKNDSSLSIIESNKDTIEGRVVAVTSHFLVIYDVNCSCERVLPIASVHSLRLAHDMETR